MPSERPVTLPKRKHYVLSNATVPVGCLKGVDIDKLDICVDRLSQVDIEVLDGKIVAITPARESRPGHSPLPPGLHRIQLHAKMILPTFVDLHTHIGKKAT